MKKITAILLIAVMTAGLLTGCGGNSIPDGRYELRDSNDYIIIEGNKFYLSYFNDFHFTYTLSDDGTVTLDSTGSLSMTTACSYKNGTIYLGDDKAAEYVKAD
ncbi:MAG: hypothetical protein FWG31_00585 [Oscillospiraceae bacterium]|nr:hypothetical protein [Oscillospiraceae bacterium]